MNEHDNQCELMGDHDATDCTCCCQERQDIERLRGEGQKDYDGMREFQRKFIDASHEIERLREENALLTKGWQPATPTALRDEIERLRGALDAVTTVEGNIMELERKVTQRGARMQKMREWMGFCPSGPTQNLWTDFTHDNPEATEWFDEDGVPR